MPISPRSEQLRSTAESLRLLAVQLNAVAAIAEQRATITATRGSSR